MAPHAALAEVGADSSSCCAERDENGNEQRRRLGLNPSGSSRRLRTATSSSPSRRRSCSISATASRSRGSSRPLGTRDRSELYRWLLHLTNTVQPTVLRALYPDRYGTAGVREAAVAAAAEQFGRIEAHLAARDWLVGEGRTAADLFLFTVTRWTRNLDRPAWDEPDVRAHWLRTLGLPGCRPHDRGAGARTAAICTRSLPSRHGRLPAAPGHVRLWPRLGSDRQTWPERAHVRCQAADVAGGALPGLAGGMERQAWSSPQQTVAREAAGPPRYDRSVAATTPETYLHDLNPAQREAVLPTEGPLLVIAGAGSGKTRVLTRRIAHLLRAVGVKPPEILAITFTNKAAAEMRERVEHLVGPPARAAWVMTFHAACGRILRREAERLGYRSNFTIYDSADQMRLTKHCLEELERDPEALHAARHPQPDLEREEPADRPGRVRRACRELLRPDRRRGLRPLPEAPLRLERGRLRRHALPHRRRARALPGGAREVAEGVPLRARRRVPGHEPRPVPAAAAARRAAPQRLRGRRPRPVDLRLPRRRHPQRARVRARLRGARGRSRSSRTTARPRTSSTPRTA